MVYIIEYVNRDGEEKKVRRSAEKVEKAVKELEEHGCTVVTWYDEEEEE